MSSARNLLNRFPPQPPKDGKFFDRFEACAKMLDGNA
jgi:hypothetical protein